jgi:hypothetical protein
MPRKETPRPSASATLTRDSGDGGGSARSALCDEALYRCLEENPLLSEASKRTYRGGIRSLLLRAPPGLANPLLHVIVQFEESERAILAADVALRTRAAWCAAVLSVFKHGLCATAPDLLAVHDKWRALNSLFSDEITYIVKTSVMSVKEGESWAPYELWHAAEQQLARDEHGSQRHLLVALSCRVPLARGGDWGLVYIVAPDSPMATDDSTNVLIWRGTAAQQAIVLIKRHKTWRLKGTQTKELPPSVRSIIAASLAKLPRSMLFVSELTQKPSTARLPPLHGRAKPSRPCSGSVFQRTTRGTPSSPPWTCRNERRIVEGAGQGNGALPGGSKGDLLPGQRERLAGHSCRGRRAGPAPAAHCAITEGVKVITACGIAARHEDGQKHGLATSRKRWRVGWGTIAGTRAATCSRAGMQRTLQTDTWTERCRALQWSTVAEWTGPRRPQQGTARASAASRGPLRL